MNGIGFCFPQQNKVNLMHIESRSSSRVPNKYEFMVECAPGGNLGQVIEILRERSEYFNIITRNHKDNRGETELAQTLVSVSICLQDVMT